MRRPGFTILELTLVLVVSATLVALAVPRFAALRDRSAVHAAMDELGSTFSAARQSAIARRAAAAVVFDTAGGTVDVRTGGRSLFKRPLGSLYGITLAANRDSAVYDPRGLGYGVSNLTVTVRRGRMVDTLTMSRLGRVRW